MTNKKEEKLIEKNLNLSLEFDRYAVEHPDIFKKIPKGSCIVITVKGDNEFNEFTMSLPSKREKCIEARKDKRGWTLRPFADTVS